MNKLIQYERFVHRLMDHETTPVDSRVAHALLGIVSEAGELSDAYKKAVGYNLPLNIENILEECHDILFYLTELIQLYGVGLEDIMDEGMTKLKKRYPDGWTQNDAVERKDKKR